MTTENIELDTLVVGAGQAGIAMSEHLGNLGISHLVLERHRIAERWRSERWDSLVANEIGRASCRERVWIEEVGESLQKNENYNNAMSGSVLKLTIDE